MRLFEVTGEKWNEKDPTKNTPYPLDMWEPYNANMLRRYAEIKKSPQITSGEAAMLIAANVNLFDAIADYKWQNTPLDDDVSRALVSVIKRVQPINKTFYRGVESENYDDEHIMPVQSWSANIATAKMFGHHIYQTVGPVKGVEIGDIYYWHGSLYGGESGFGDNQAEWFLLNPKKENIR